MQSVTTEAWVLYRGPNGNGKANGNGSRIDAPGAHLRLESFTFPAPGENEVLVEPLLGSWEGNMSHAVMRQPVDICRQRGEDKVVIGNAGVVRVLKPGRQVTTVKEGDVCLVFCNGVWDEHGYPMKIYAYDAPGTVGVMAKRTKLHERQLIPLPSDSGIELDQWAAFSLRFITAWANWKVAYGAWRIQTDGERAPQVWGWGGGATLAELLLAHLAGCKTAMISSQRERLKSIESAGIQAVDRGLFPDLCYDRERYLGCDEYRERYLSSERRFLRTVQESTDGQGVSIFVDYIGQPVFRATLKSLSRPGVITSAGWKGGMDLAVIRALECMSWHTHVHTHYARYSEGVEAVMFAVERGWAPPAARGTWAWEEIPELAREHALGRITSMFPIFRVNAA
jgi:NADPH:quinone reductase-like Zn-dependent oxidoreductase